MRPFKKKQPFLKNISLRLTLAVLLTAALTLTGCSGGGKTSPQGTSEQPSSSQSQSQESGAHAGAGSADTQLHFIDVGQGLSVLIESDGHFLLFDGGDRKTSSLVVSYLKEQGVKTLDYVIASHYDADHLNGVVGALNAFQVSQVLAPDYETDTKVFQSFQSAIEKNRIPLSHPAPGDSFTLGNASFTVLAPQDKSYQNG
ncbi:predicted hydrolase (Metallo-beta-lactamase superfamily) [Clostridium sp. CAG:299]|nr:predicted hydrolase (Metallo-beta-lactamase superfamily) [Clostridium sp. CAG:299]